MARNGANQRVGKEDGRAEKCLTRQSPLKAITAQNAHE